MENLEAEEDWEAFRGDVETGGRKPEILRGSGKFSAKREPGRYSVGSIMDFVKEATDPTGIRDRIRENITDPMMHKLMEVGIPAYEILELLIDAAREDKLQVGVLCKGLEKLLTRSGSGLEQEFLDDPRIEELAKKINEMLRRGQISETQHIFALMWVLPLIRLPFPQFDLAVQPMAQTFYQHIQRIGDMELAMVCSKAANMAMKSGKWQTLKLPLFQEVSKRARHMSDAGVANVIFAAGEFELQRPIAHPLLLQLLPDRSSITIERFSTKELALMMWGFMKMGVKDPELIRSVIIVIRARLKSMLSKDKSLNLPMILLVLHKLAINDELLFQDIVAAMGKKPQRAIKRTTDWGICALVYVWPQVGPTRHIRKLLIEVLEKRQLDHNAVEFAAKGPKAFQDKMEIEYQDMRQQMLEEEMQNA